MADDHGLDQPNTPRSLRPRVSASSLLSMFKARPSPSSVSRMDTRRTLPVSYADPKDSNDKQVLNPVTKGPPTLDPPDSDGSSNHSLCRVKSNDSVLSNINVAPAMQSITDKTDSPVRELPARSTRAKINYAATRKIGTPSSDSKRMRSQPIIRSDTIITPSKATKSLRSTVKPDTARNRVRDDIATKTKARRDAYLLHHQDYFLPLLPENNYITKLARSNHSLPSVSPHQQLQTQPENITAVMKPYQIQGLSFLTTMYKNGMSAILGDEMGLGKTLQTLSLIQHLEETQPCPPGLSRPYLVVCPLSVLESWYNECRKWTPKLRPMRFHGSNSEREHLKRLAIGKVDRFGNETTQPERNKERNSAKSGRGRRVDDEAGFDILLTTYETFVAEASWFKLSFVWRYIILDEGHKIKNEQSNVSQALQSLNAEHRLLLTGTPMQNNLREMWALLHWLFPDVFTAKTADNFAAAFDLGKGKVSTSFMDDARRLLELVMIRRLKSSPGVNLGLPPKSEVLLYVPLTPMQRFWYTRLLTKAGNSMIDDLFTGLKDKEQKTLHAELSEDKDLSRIEKAINGAVEGIDQWAETRQILQQAVQNDAAGEKETGAYKKLLNLIMQLRKCCVHPYQIRGAAPDPYFLGDHIIHASGKFLVLSKLIDVLVIKQKKKILVFSGFTHTLDYCEDLLSLKGADQHQAAPFRYLRLDGSTARAKRNLDIRLFSEESSEFKVMLISTRAGGLGLNLTAASDIVFLDEDWNPQVTVQAEARSHRIGQTKPVTIYKICTQGTVEEQMMGRIRKKLYLSAKITESMRDIHSWDNSDISSRKRKRADDGDLSNPVDDGVPQLGMTQLMSLVRRGATTLAHPEVDINEMLSWDFQTIIEKCKDRPVDPHVNEQGTGSVDEKEWLARMERVECAVLDGVKYQLQVDADKISPAELTRSDRRIGKNTTVMVDGFAINKESLQCADWEAVPTMAGKDPRLAEPKREKAPPINHQEYCQVCHDGGEMIVCSGCPRLYHEDCLSDTFKKKIGRKSINFYCSQHQCFDCEKNTTNAGGLIYRCRWCEKGFCEDCLDWNNSNLVGDSIPEFDMLEYVTKNAWYIECHDCVQGAREDATFASYLDSERLRIEKEYDAYQQEKMKMPEVDIASQLLPSRDETMTEAPTLESSDEEATPGATEPVTKRCKVEVKLDDDSLAGASCHANSETEEELCAVHPSLDWPDVHPSTNKGFLRRRI